MTKEQIKNEAAEYAKGKYGGENAKMWAIAQIHAGRDGFVAGASWRINSVWHKPEEVPETDRQILIERTEGFEIYIFTRSYFFSWKDISRYNLVRWAYLDDLIPTEDETA